MAQKVRMKAQEVTLKISLSKTSVSRVLLVPDTIRLVELYALITFLFDWN